MSATTPEGSSSSTASDEPVFVDATWHLVCAHDGTILMATGLLPASAIGGRIDNRSDVPEDLKDAVAAALEHSRLHPGPPAALIAELHSIDGSVAITVLNAMPLRCRPTDLTVVLRATLEVSARHARAADVQVIYEPDRRLPPELFLDGEKIAWAVNTLVENALQYVRGGSMLMPNGEIIVRTKYNTVNGEVMIEVQDNGPGIPSDRLRALFDRTPTGAQIAVGLPLVREIISAHSGSLEVDSQADSYMSGAVVRLTLPVA